MLQQDALGDQRAQAVAENNQRYTGVFRLCAFAQGQYVVADAFKGVGFAHIAQLAVDLAGAAMTPVILGVNGITLLIQRRCQCCVAARVLGAAVDDLYDGLGFSTGQRWQ